MKTSLPEVPQGYLRGTRQLGKEERVRLQRAWNLVRQASPAGAAEFRRVEDLNREERLALRYLRDTMKDLGLIGKGLINSRAMRGRYKDPLAHGHPALPPRIETTD